MALNVKELAGNEIAFDYKRTAPEAQGRWGEAWAVFKGSFGKIVLINLLMLIFLSPAITLLVTRSLYIGIWAYELPLNSNTGLGYPVYPDTRGLIENLYLQVDLIFYAVLIAAGVIASVGIAGGAYSIKKLLNTQGKFTLKGFFRGVKSGYVKTVIPVTVMLVLFYACVLVGDWKDLVIARGGNGAGPITAYVFIIIATVLIGLYCAWLFSVGVSYKVNFGTALKKAFSFLITTPLQTVLLAGFALLPVWLYLIGTAVQIIMYIAFALFIFFGFSFILLAWTSYTRWVFDTAIPPEFAKEENKKTAAKQPQKAEADQTDVARELLAAGKSELIGRPILPVADKPVFTPLGAVYTRGDLKKLAEARANLGGQIEEYESRHANDPVYAEYNKLFAEREKALPAPEGKKGKKKKVSAQNLLRN